MKFAEKRIEYLLKEKMDTWIILNYGLSYSIIDYTIYKKKDLDTGEIKC